MKDRRKDTIKLKCKQVGDELRYLTPKKKWSYGCLLWDTCEAGNQMLKLIGKRKQFNMEIKITNDRTKA